MKCFIAGFTLVVLFAGTQYANGATIFTEDVTFEDGDTYWSAEIHEDAHAEVLGGLFENRLQLYDDATANLSGGIIQGGFAMEGNSKASIHSGTFINTYIFMLGSAELDIYGGRMPDAFLDATYWSGNSLTTFHGYDLVLASSGGSEGDGFVTGVFADNTSFMVNLRGEDTASRVRLAPIPEPSPFIMSAFGVIALLSSWRRKR